ncbi:hypothetical protein KGO5_01732 [Sinorhizobium sp. KGO-5]|uniref:hypothetical protein n=1 Tax=Sinorhizobium sp. KGO-5 TaxID=1470810 RepID=UPI0029493880|nr:hypothetical protein KGO5_01732 [Sinorhizobium sp. KGO-5]
MPKGCPHKDVRFCPLYVAAHGGTTSRLGCIDGHIEEGTCAAARKLDYAAAVAKLEAHRPGLVAECRFQEEAAEIRAQRLRNMRAAGLH